jgi:hypothetical protein
MAPGFTALDWEGGLDQLATALGLGRAVAMPRTAPGVGSPYHDTLLAEAIDTTARRGAAFEGFFRSTRPFATHPGKFIHDHMMVRRGADGLLGFDLRCGMVKVTGWVLPQHAQLFVVGAEHASGSPAFGIFHAPPSARADVIDGILLACALDTPRTPTACAVIFERVGELSGDAAADDARLEEFGRADPRASPGSIPRSLAAHLVRNIGPEPLAMGGDWLLQLPLTGSAAIGTGIGNGPQDYARAFPPDLAADEPIVFSSRRR